MKLAYQIIKYIVVNRMNDNEDFHNNKNFDYYYLDKFNKKRSNKIFKSKLDTESLEKMDIKIIENYLRKKKLEIINKK